MKRERWVVTPHPWGGRYRWVLDELAPPGPGEIQVAVHTTAIAQADLMMAAGVYPGQGSLGDMASAALTGVTANRNGIPRLAEGDLTPGYDFSGEVVALGPGVKGWMPGDRVCGLCVNGGWSTGLNVPATRCVRLAPGLSLHTAAALPLNHVTAVQMLRRVARVSRGERVLIHGAGGGVGSALLAWSKVLGLEAWGEASPQHHELIKKNGGKIYTGGGEKFHHIFDARGGGHWREGGPRLLPGGTLVLYGMLTALKQGRVDWVRSIAGLLSSPRENWMARCYAPWSLAGYYITVWLRENPEAFTSDLTDVVRTVAAGRVKPVIHGAFPLANIREAVAEVAGRRAQGKVLVQVAGGD